MAFRLMFCVCLAWAIAGGETPAQAETAEQAMQQCERAIQNGARRGGVPEEVLHAVSLTETGRLVGGKLRPWPWAINREGQGHWFSTRDEAMAFARNSLEEGRTSFDVGCFQINYRWHGQNFASLEAMFEPETGADYAAQFLASLHADRGDWSAAAGAYHSLTPHYASVYRARFDRLRAGIGGAPIVVAAAQAPAAEAPPRKSRTRMSARPRIITIDRTPAPSQEARTAQPDTLGGFVAAAGERF